MNTYGHIYDHKCVQMGYLFEDKGKIENIKLMHTFGKKLWAKEN